MSLVGTRPPTVDEWEKYELHHRSRMSTKPGITGMTSLFLSQSYQDAWDDYARSLKKEGFARWDYIVLTASNEEQAEAWP